MLNIKIKFCPETEAFLMGHFVNCSEDRSALLSAIDQLYAQFPVVSMVQSKTELKEKINAAIQSFAKKEG